MHVPSKFDSTYLIHVKGLPWTATKQDILDFFGDINILHGTNGIHFAVNNAKINSAYIQMATEKDYCEAKKSKMEYMGYSVVRGNFMECLPFLKTLFEFK